MVVGDFLFFLWYVFQDKSIFPHQILQHQALKIQILQSYILFLKCNNEYSHIITTATILLISFSILRIRRKKSSKNKPIIHSQSSGWSTEYLPSQSRAIRCVCVCVCVCVCIYIYIYIYIYGVGEDS